MTTAQIAALALRNAKRAARRSLTVDEILRLRHLKFLAGNLIPQITRLEAVVRAGHGDLPSGAGMTNVELLYKRRAALAVINAEAKPLLARRSA